ncbi:MAG: CoA transferase, partial [Novosphingobium sp.]
LVPPQETAGYPRQIDPYRQPSPTADGHIVIVPYTPDSIDIMIELMAAPELASDPRFADYRSRVKYMSAFYQEMALRTPKRTTAEWMRLMIEHDIPAMPVRDLQDVTDDPHLQAVDFFQHRIHPTEGEYLKMRAPVTFSVCSFEVCPARSIGEDNAELGGPPLPQPVKPRAG